MSEWMRKRLIKYLHLVKTHTMYQCDTVIHERSFVKTLAIYEILMCLNALNYTSVNHFFIK